jgi:hypothetical protein
MLFETSEAESLGVFLSVLSLRPKPGRYIDPLPHIRRHGVKVRSAITAVLTSPAKAAFKLAVRGRLTPTLANRRPREGNPLLVAPRNKARGRAHRLDGAGIAAGEQIITLQPLGHIR